MGCATSKSKNVQVVNGTNCTKDPKSITLVRYEGDAEESREFDAQSQIKDGYDDDRSINEAELCDKNEEDDDNFVSLLEATAYVEQELKMSQDKAKRFVLTIDKNNDGKVSSLELVLLNRRIRSIKELLQPKFLKFDPKGSGFVTPGNAVIILGEVFNGLPKTCLEAMVTRYDHDGNNMVDFGEFVEFYSGIKARKCDLELKFKELDKDNSGDLDASELVETLIQECALSELQARSLVEDFDYNKDGSIDKSEFFTMWMKLFD